MSGLQILFQNDTTSPLSTRTSRFSCCGLPNHAVKIIKLVAELGLEPKTLAYETNEIPFLRTPQFVLPTRLELAHDCIESAVTYSNLSTAAIKLCGV